MYYIIIIILFIYCRKLRTIDYVMFRILGIDRLLTNIMTDWGNDIKRNQIPQIVGGVGPMHSLRQLSEFIDRV